LLLGNAQRDGRVAWPAVAAGSSELAHAAAQRLGRWRAFFFFFEIRWRAAAAGTLTRVRAGQAVQQTCCSPAGGPGANQARRAGGPKVGIVQPTRGVLGPSCKTGSSSLSKVSMLFSLFLFCFSHEHLIRALIY